MHADTPRFSSAQWVILDPRRGSRITLLITFDPFSVFVRSAFRVCSIVFSIRLMHGRGDLDHSLPQLLSRSGFSPRRPTTGRCFSLLFRFRIRTCGELIYDRGCSFCRCTINTPGGYVRILISTRMYLPVVLWCSGQNCIPDHNKRVNIGPCVVLPMFPRFHSCVLQE